MNDLAAIGDVREVDSLSSPDVGVLRDDAVKGCKENLNFFAAVALPEVYQFPFPPILIAVWQLLCRLASKEVGQDRLALGLPRGFAKTLLLKLFVIWIVMFTDRKFILVVCNTATLAENFIADVVDTLSSSNILRIFGDWRLGMEKDTQELKKFTFRGRNIILAGLGSESSLRGLNLKFVRPDVILMDDMQSKEQSESPVESNKQLLWMLGTLMKANNKIRCMYVYLGNMYPSEGCILKKLKTNPGWTSFITGAILEDGESLWPELRSIESLLEELENDESMGHPEIFHSEVMNDDEAGSRSTVDFTKINIWRADLDLYPEGGWVIIDPSLAKTASDDCAIGVFLLFDGEPVLWDLEVGKFNEQQKVDKCITFCMRYGLGNIVVEAVAYQESLCFWMEQRKQQLGLTTMNIFTISPGSTKKNSRIIAAAKQLTAEKERIWLHPRVRSQVVHQFVYWNPLKTNNKDDILDLLAYAYKVILEYGAALLNPLEMLESTASSSFGNTLNLAF